MLELKGVYRTNRLEYTLRDFVTQSSPPRRPMKRQESQDRQTERLAPCYENKHGEHYFTCCCSAAHLSMISSRPKHRGDELAS